VEAASFEPGFLSLSPALAAVVLALLFRNVFVALSGGVIVGGMVFVGGNPFKGLLHAVDPLLLGAVYDKDHIKIAIFSFLIAGMVGIMGKGGGTRAMVGGLSRLAKGRRSTQGMTVLSGFFVFFDDYANCLIVGNTMRPLYDKLRITREKLAYLVDSTSAPVATLALISTWVGFEVGVMKEGLDKAGIDMDGYAFFLQGWGYRFYPIFTLFFVALIAFTGRDFGAMAKVEKEGPPDDQGPLPGGDDAAEYPSELDAEPSMARLVLAIAPIAALLGLTFVSLWISGSGASAKDAKLFQIIGNADGYGAMIHGSLSGFLCAGLICLVGGLLPLGHTVEAAVAGMRELFEAMLVLFFAWALGASMGELKAADFLVSLLSTSLPVFLLPTVVFVVAAATAFATGTSFGTMAILMPMVIPLAAAISPENMPILFAASGSVLAGACFGDHCSPISDTTVLSALGSGCDVLTHVKTQLPYALTTGGIAIVLGTLPTGLGVSPLITLPLGLLACWAVVRYVGKPAPALDMSRMNPAAD
jgi:Na+/H+ antiporter NhaC